MDKRARADQLLAELGETLSLRELKLEESTQCCILLFEGNLVLNIEFDEGTASLLFSCYLGDLPEEDNEPLLRELMAANLYSHRIGGATLGLEEETGGVMLSQSHAVGELDRAGFEKAVESFVNQAEKWSGRITRRVGSSDGSVLPGARPSVPNPMVFG
jgi:hypothetical protein